MFEWQTDMTQKRAYPKTPMGYYYNSTGASDMLNSYYSENIFETIYSFINQTSLFDR